MCVFISCHLLLTSRGDRMQALSSKCKIEKADYTD